jgi:hypothetical protein
VLQKILNMVALEIKGTVMTFRVSVQPTKGLLALTCHITQHKLLLTTAKLTKGHSRKDFKGKHY